MTDHSYHVYVVQGRGQRDYADGQAALVRVPARMTALPFIATEDEMIARMRDADALVTSASPVTRGVMSALEGLKVDGQRDRHAAPSTSRPRRYAPGAVRRAR